MRLLGGARRGVAESGQTEAVPGATAPAAGVSQSEAGRFDPAERPAGAGGPDPEGLRGAAPQPSPPRSQVLRAPESVLGDSAAYVLARLGIIYGRVSALVDRRRSVDPNPDDPFRGLYLADDHVASILSERFGSKAFAWDDGEAIASLEQDALQARLAGRDVRLAELAERLGLDRTDVDLLLIAMAPDLDLRFERLYGYLNDDVTRRRATVTLAFDLAGESPWTVSARRRMSSDGLLVRYGLLEVDDHDRPALSRSLHVPDRVVGHLLGAGMSASALSGAVSHPDALWSDPLGDSLGRVLEGGVGLVYLRDRPGASVTTLAAGAFKAAGKSTVAIDLANLDPVRDAAEIFSLARREAVLTDAGLVVGPLDVIAELGNAAVRSYVARLVGVEPCANRKPVVPVIFYGRRAWDPSWSDRVPVTAEVKAAPAPVRSEWWQKALGAGEVDVSAAADVASQFVLSAEQVARAVVSARNQAVLDCSAVGIEHVRQGARAQNSAGLERLARRIVPGVGWEDLVLTPSTADSLRDLSARARRRSVVLDEWGMRPGGGRGRGITALFAGDSGTGKTMSAEVVAGELGLDLYAVNLATVVDKYVGETEKNLERIFSEADGVNAVLLFDEADAIFGKRSEVRDANDRYANIEVAYLLQRMETFDGIAILATNLRANVDDAFARRLDLVVDFPKPDVEQRKALWERCLAPGVPRADDLDLDFCARSFELSGGNIRSVATAAAYAAADSGRAVSMDDLVKAIQLEYRKLGRLVVAGEFGQYYASAVPNHRGGVRRHGG